MSEDMDDKEVASVLALPYPARYEYFLQRVADEGIVWSLGSESGWVLDGDEHGREYVPAWPEERFAAACVGGNWQGTEPRGIELTEWRERWTPGMIADQRLVAVFPTPAGKAISVDPQLLEWDLEEQLSCRVQGEQEIEDNGRSH